MRRFPPFGEGIFLPFLGSAAAHMAVINLTTAQLLDTLIGMAAKILYILHKDF